MSSNQASSWDEYNNWNPKPEDAVHIDTWYQDVHKNGPRLVKAPLSVHRKSKADLKAQRAEVHALRKIQGT